LLIDDRLKKELLKSYSNLKKRLPSLYEKWEELLTGV